MAFPLGQIVVGLGLLFGNGAAAYLSRLLFSLFAPNVWLGVPLVLVMGRDWEMVSGRIAGRTRLDFIKFH